MSKYGTADQTFQAVGGEQGLARLVDAFYDIMSSDPVYATIWAWHPKDDPSAAAATGTKPKQLARDKLAAFLSGWMGGPRRFQERFGSIRIPPAHAHLPVTSTEMDLWLSCMHQALGQQGYPDDLVAYLMRELAVPAERIRLACERQQGG